MGISAEVALAAANSYTAETVIGGGAIQGKNCTISSIAPITGGNRVTFAWELDDGTEKTGTMDVMNGIDGGETGAFVTPEMYGAKGDGSTDDTAAFTAAFADCKTVVCKPGKTYTFAGTVDCSTMSGGELNINGATLLNFHIKIYIANDGYKSRGSGAPTERFKIHNGKIGQWGAIDDGWQTPAIQSGAELWLENICFTNTPHIAALTNSYRDRMVFSKLLMVYNSSLWSEIGDWTLDAVNMITGNGTFAKINSTDYASVAANGGKFAGDGWIIDNVDQFVTTRQNDYSFVHLYRQHTVQINRCIQTRIMVGFGVNARFTSCHWETANAYPKMETITNGTPTLNKESAQMAFENCYFNNNYVIESANKKVSYTNCFFRAGSTAENPEISLETTFGEHDYYSMECSMNDCFIGNVRFSLSDFRNSREHAKLTCNSKNNTSNEKTLSECISATGTIPTKTIASGGYAYPATGTYSYVGYTFTNGAGIAHESYSWTRTVSSTESDQDSSSAISGLVGGWGFEIYRTLPGGTIQRARYYDNPIEEIEKPVTNKQFVIRERGNYCVISKTVYHSTTDSSASSVVLPWVTVSAIPSYDVNNQVYERNGVLVSKDNQAITQLNANSTYTQVPLTFS